MNLSFADDACPVLTEFLFALAEYPPFENDIHALVEKHEGFLRTNSDSHSQASRAFSLTDLVVRHIAPLALDETGESELATRLRSLPKIVDQETAKIFPGHFKQPDAYWFASIAAFDAAKGSYVTAATAAARSIIEAELAGVAGLTSALLYVDDAGNEVLS